MHGVCKQPSGVMKFIKDCKKWMRQLYIKHHREIKSRKGKTFPTRGQKGLHWGDDIGANTWRRWELCRYLNNESSSPSAQQAQRLEKKSFLCFAGTVDIQIIQLTEHFLSKDSISSSLQSVMILLLTCLIVWPWLITPVNYWALQGTKPQSNPKPNFNCQFFQ